MPTFLLKTEPSDYAWEDLVNDKRSAWTGVTNAAAQKHMREISKGDEILLYHTGDQKRIVGLARVLRGAYPDPERPGLTAEGHPKFVLIDIAPARPAGTQAATLAAIKADKRFADFALVRQSRLSVMPVPPPLDKALRTIAGL
ncbi:MAG: EVE domain-containing protein [Phycisphaerales bacterium]|nr:EVE domain-containing protein [Phycisphaerales bacterium]